jgi:signal transduction histidine kinase
MIKSNTLLLKTLKDLNKGFAYCELVIRKSKIPTGWTFLLVNSEFEKQLNRKSGSTAGKTNSEIFPDFIESKISKIGNAIVNKKSIHFSGLIPETNNLFRANAFCYEKNTFVIVITNIKEKVNSIGKLNILRSKRDEINAELIIVRKKLAFEKAERENKSRTLIATNKSYEVERDEKEKIKKKLKTVNESLIIQRNKKHKNIIDLVSTNKELQLENYKKQKDILELFLEKKQAEKSEWLKTAFLTNVSHEIRTPMNGILGFSGLLSNISITDEKREKYIQIITKNSHRMLNAINSIISISKIESGAIKVDLSLLNANDILESLASFLRSKAESLGLQFLVNKGLPFVDAVIKTDKEKVFVILTNLIENAIDFTKIGSVEIGYTQKGKYLEFYVTDSGIGIDKERHEAIFNRATASGFRSSETLDSVGLSLAISKSFAESLGVVLRVESEKGKGASFYLKIPYGPEQRAERVTRNADPTDIQEKKLKILIVEDDETSGLLLSIGLEEISQEILHACNGLEAVEVCRNNPDLDFILMDIQMPLMDGYQATQEIRKFNKGVIIIAQTAYAFASEKEKAIESGCNKCLAKPILMTQLMVLIEEYFC